MSELARAAMAALDALPGEGEATLHVALRRSFRDPQEWKAIAEMDSPTLERRISMVDLGTTPAAARAALRERLAALADGERP